MTGKIVQSITIKSNVDAIKKSVRGPYLALAANAGGLVIDQAAKINVENTFSSHSTGALSNSITTNLDSYNNDSAWVSVGPVGIVYARIHELGGIIKTVHAKWLHFKTYDGKWHKVKEVHMPARPYLRPACDSNHQRISDAVAFQIQKGIDNVAS